MTWYLILSGAVMYCHTVVTFHRRWFSFCFRFFSVSFQCRFILLLAVAWTTLVNWWAFERTLNTAGRVVFTPEATVFHYLLRQLRLFVLFTTELLSHDKLAPSRDAAAAHFSMNCRPWNFSFSGVTTELNGVRTQRTAPGNTIQGWHRN